MTKKERAEWIHSYLEKLYPETPIPLTHDSPYTLLVAVLLSAQCTDLRVNSVTPELFNLADTAEKMVKLSVKKIETIVRPCGLAPRKALAIHQLSNILLADHDGAVPKNMGLLEKLPGVGHKTASVVMAQAFGEPTFPVDTHIHRLAQRWGLSKGRNVRDTESDLKKLFQKQHWNQLHLRIIFYGREYCSARGCDGRICFICRTCYPNRKRPIRTLKA